MSFSHVSGILSLIKNYGFSAILFIVVSTPFIHPKLRSWLVRNLRTYIRSWILYEKKSDNIDHQTCRLENLISRSLLSFVVHYDACRAYLFEYHGYNPKLTPIPYKFASNTYEEVHPVRSPKKEKDKLQNIPIFTCRWWCRQLVENREISLPDITEIKESDPAAYEILKSQEIFSVYIISINDYCGKPLGFVGIDYCERIRKLSEAEMYAFRLEAIKLAGIITLKKNGSLEHQE